MLDQSRVNQRHLKERWWSSARTVLQRIAGSLCGAAAVPQQLFVKRLRVSPRVAALLWW